jgi:hypothetical protein
MKVRLSSFLITLPDKGLPPPGPHVFGPLGSETPDLNYFLTIL